MTKSTIWLAFLLVALLAFLLAPLQRANGMRVDPERIWARIRLEAADDPELAAQLKLARNRRQLIGGGSPKEETIQVTAPLFSSRLFEYGSRAGDKEMAGGVDMAKKLPLSRPITFFGQSHSAVWILSNGGIGFEQGARQYRANMLPSGVKLIAPFWNRNDLKNGGKVFYREIASGRVLERGQSEIRYQYDLEVKVHSAVLATFEKMQPVGTDPLPEENTNTFQMALFMTSNGTFANFIYRNIGWTQGAEAGFNAGDGVNFFALPTSGTGNIMYLEDYGNTGIPGEWMFILGSQHIQRCKAGIKGDTCDEACAVGEWGPDCVRCCHCADEKAGCNEGTGECKQGGCAQCWAGANCQQKESRCDTQRQCGQNAIQMTDNNRCGEPEQRCECLAGFRGDPYGECLDIDECTQPKICHQKAQCTNTPGRFFCQCPDGFQGDGISECSASFLYPFGQSHPLPSDRHGRVEWQLKYPLRIFGRDRPSLWLTGNGLILVKGAKNVAIKSGERQRLDEMEIQGVAPFFAPMDLAKNGQIFVEETTDPRILAKAAQMVNEQMGGGGIGGEEQQFIANNALLVTYVNVSLGGVNDNTQQQQPPMNTFQALLIGGRKAKKNKEENEEGGGGKRRKAQPNPITFVQLLYSDIQWGDEAEAGIMAPERANSILLPGSGTEAIEQISQLSNVRSHGIWLYRIDGPSPSACLQADMQPPYCEARLPSLISGQSSSPQSVQPSSSPATIPSSTSSSTSIAPTIQTSFGLEPGNSHQQNPDEEEEEEVVDARGEEHPQEDIHPPPQLPEFPAVEKNGQIPSGPKKEEKKPLSTTGTSGNKKPAIVQIQSREFAEMPPDAFDDGTVSRATTRAPEEEEEAHGADIPELIPPSLIVPELVRPQQPPIRQQKPDEQEEDGPPEEEEGQGGKHAGQANVEETLVVEEPPSPPTQPKGVGRRPPTQIQIEQHSPLPPSIQSAATTMAPTVPSSTAATMPTTAQDEEPMQTIGPEEEEEGRTGGGGQKQPTEDGMPPVQQPSATSTIAQTVPAVPAVPTPMEGGQQQPKQPSSSVGSITIFNTTKSKSTGTTKRVVIKPLTTEAPKQKPDNPDGDDPTILMDWDHQGNPLLDGQGPPGSKLSIVVPIAIVLVWLVVLVVVAIFLCCRRRQTQERLRTLYGPAYQIRPVYTMRVNKLGAGGPAGPYGAQPDGTYEEHLEKAAQQLSAEMAYNPNPLWAGPGRYSLYGSYWNISPEGSAAGRINGHSKAQRSGAAAGGQLDISSPRSQESGGGGGRGGGGGSTTMMFGSPPYVTSNSNGGGSGPQQQMRTGTGTTSNGEREAGHSEYYSSQRSSAVGTRFSGGRH